LPSKYSLKYGYRSGLEKKIGEQLTKLGVLFEYEKLKINYIKPESDHVYTPDWQLPNGIIGLR
jgi:hypothetical protein